MGNRVKRAWGSTAPMECQQSKSKIYLWTILRKLLIYSSLPRKRESSALILLGFRLHGNDATLINQRILNFQ